MADDAVTKENAWSGAGIDQLFTRLLQITFGVMVVLMLIISLITVPEPTREEQETLPPQYAELILPPAPEPEPPEPEPEEEEEEEEEEEPEPEPEPEEEVVQEEEPPPIVDEEPQTVQEAREKASVSGLLAFRDQLQDMRAAVDRSALNASADIKQGDATASEVSRSMLTSNASSRVASVQTSGLSMETGGVALSGQATTIVEAPVEEEANLPVGAMRVAKAPDSSRSIEDVRRVFDANKGAIYAIYNRALRANPGLAGKVVLELTIEPDGSVSDCTVSSSEIDDDDLLRKITRRVRLFNFGAEAVTVTKISYPVHFLPS
ncbi:MAG: AgmX/PglI C-terminal domain-containing protein [Pseudomonadota bacterium]